MDKAFTKDTIEVELARIQHNMNVLTAISIELKKGMLGRELSLGPALSNLMARLTSVLDDMIGDVQTSIRELYTLLNHKHPY